MSGQKVNNDKGLKTIFSPRTQEEVLKCCTFRRFDEEGRLLPNGKTERIKDGKRNYFNGLLFRDMDRLVTGKGV